MLTAGDFVFRQVSSAEDEVRMAEPFELWHTEIVTMRRMVEVWDAVRESKLDALVQLVKIKSWRRRGYAHLSHKVSYKGSRLLYALLRPTRRPIAPATVSWRALLLIQKVVNERLASHTAPLLRAASDHHTTLTATLIG
jgi:hypothetical protein